MLFENGTVHFGSGDMAFLARHGIDKASQLCINHYKKTGLPLIEDTKQLSSVLGLSHRDLHRLIRHDTSLLYFPLQIPKKSGGFRKLHVPSSALRATQHRILSKILVNLPVSPYATAYHPGARLVDNASPHVGKKFLLKMDIVDFFGSITHLMVVSKIFNTKRFPSRIGAILTKLCCLNEALPQGAPTSPAISNLVMKSFDDILGAWCEKRGISYTRYCDDLTFSSNAPLGSAYRKASALLSAFGFEVNEKKTKFVGGGARQSVTGITVNQKLSASRDYKRHLRAELHAIFKFGLVDAALHELDTENIPLDTVEPLLYLDRVEGKVRFVLSIEPDNQYFKDALTKIRELCKNYSPSSKYYSYFQ